MKKVEKGRKLSKATRRGQRQGDPISTMLENIDDDLLAMLLQAAQSGVSFETALADPNDGVSLFAVYLESCGLGKLHENAQAELVADLVGELIELKLDANGGNREARENVQVIYDLLDNALDNRSLHPIAMMMTGKLFNDAGWAIPDSLKNSIAEVLRGTQPDGPDLPASDIVSPLMEFADQAGQNGFDLHECVISLSAGLPPEALIILLLELIAGKQAVIHQAVAGFILHPDASVAQSVTEALAASARHTPVESSIIERLVRMRPWLPPSRQTHLDAAIRTMRSNASPPVKAELPKVIKCYASVCDGSGTRSLFATQRAGTRYQIANVMIKSSGVAEALDLTELAKSEMDNIVRHLKSAMPVAETDLPGIARMLGLAIADNFASGSLPPFRLIEVIESLGLGPVNADHSSPTEIVTKLLADLPAQEKGAAAVGRAHADLMESEFKYQWFEAGEEVEDLLHPIKGSKKRVAALMKTYLPERRLFWARQCAISALAMRGNGKTRHSLWKQLALVGRDIASDLPLDRIPLMKQIAEISVEAFQQQL